jgi:ribonuclease BN (tRNA processing enzyme)
VKIQFIGAGSAFNKVDGQSNAIVISESGKKLLIDCGSTCWTTADKLGLGLKYTDIDAVYISHLHADHVGGLEELAFCTYFNPSAERPRLFCNTQLMHELWEQALRGGLESIQGKVVTITEYFDCHPVENSSFFVWEGISFIPVQTVHVMAGYHIKYSYGLIIQEIGVSSEKPKVFFTSDTQFAPNQIMDFYRSCDVIFQDCETSPFKSGVHANFADLTTLSDDIRSKMWLYHYQPGTFHPAAVDNGFCGFVKSGQCFEF